MEKVKQLFVTMFWVSAILLAIGLCIPYQKEYTPPPEPPQKVSTLTDTEHEQALTQEVNRVRVDVKNIYPLQPDEELSRVAKLKANDMKENHYFLHNSPKYGSPENMIKQFYPNNSFSSFGEVIGIGYVDSQEVVDAWLHSPSHANALFGNKYDVFGVGVVKGDENSDYASYWVIELGR